MKKQVSTAFASLGMLCALSQSSTAAQSLPAETCSVDLPGLFKEILRPENKVRGSEVSYQGLDGQPERVIAYFLKNLALSRSNNASARSPIANDVFEWSVEGQDIRFQNSDTQGTVQVTHCHGSTVAVAIHGNDNRGGFNLPAKISILGPKKIRWELPAMPTAASCNGQELVQQHLVVSWDEGQTPESESISEEMIGYYLDALERADSKLNPAQGWGGSITQRHLGELKLTLQNSKGVLEPQSLELLKNRMWDLELHGSCERITLTKLKGSESTVGAANGEAERPSISGEAK